MNLQVEVTEIRRRIAEDYPDDQLDANVTDAEIVDWLFMAEQQIGFDLSDEALDATSMVALKPLTVGSGVSDVALPSDFMRYLSVGLNISGTGYGYKSCRIMSLEELRGSVYNPNSRPTEQFPNAAFFGGRIYFLPASRSAAGSVELRQVSVPTRRFKRFRGSITAVTSQTIVIDTKLLGLGFPDDYFNASSIVFNGHVAESRGMERTVSDYTGATGTFTLSAAAAGAPDINVADPYEVGEISVVPTYLRPALYQYVAFLAFSKGNEDEAQKRLAEYARQIASVNDRYAVQTARGILR